MLLCIEACIWCQTCSSWWQVLQQELGWDAQLQGEVARLSKEKAELQVWLVYVH